MHTSGLQTPDTHRSMKVDKNVTGVVIRNEYKRAIDKEQKKNKY